jgi:hypothetical protein
MRDHVRETEMMFFFENFLPLANTLREKGKTSDTCTSDSIVLKSLSFVKHELYFRKIKAVINSLTGERLKANGSDLEAKVFDTLYLQVWSLNIAGSALFLIILNHV